MKDIGYFKFLLIAVVAFAVCCIVLITFVDTPETLGHFRLLGTNWLTIHCNKGRLGNQMSTYATLYGIARRNNRTPIGQWCNMKRLKPYFQLTMSVMPDVDKTKLHQHHLASYFRTADSNLPGNVKILTGHLYPRSYTFYHKYRDEITREFAFKPDLSEYAQDVLASLSRKRIPKTEVFIGIHIRRGDFCNILERYRGRSFDKKYLLKAMGYFRRKYELVLFVVVSDDREWCENNLGGIPDVVIAPEPTDSARDLVILANCNHTIVTYGSYGYWGAYLAGGETVFFTGYLAPDSPLRKEDPKKFQEMPPGWIGISTTPKGYWKRHKPERCVHKES